MTGHAGSRRIVLTDLLPPPLPRAACARWRVDVWTNDLPEIRAHGLEVCKRCPELAPCREWVQTIPRRERVGVIAGTDWSPKAGRPTKAAK